KRKGRGRFTNSRVLKARGLLRAQSRNHRKSQLNRELDWRHVVRRVTRMQNTAMKRTPSESFHWTKTREQLDKLLRAHYRACTRQELPPQLCAVLKKLEEESPEFTMEKD